MARKKNSRKRKNKLSREMKAQIKGLLLLAFSLFSAFGLLQTGQSGGVGQFISLLLRSIAGNAAIIVPLTLAALAVNFLLSGSKLQPGNRLAGFLMAALMVMGWFHLQYLSPRLPFNSAAVLFQTSINEGLAGNGGGMIGSLIFASLIYLFGKTGSLIIGGAIFTVAILLLLNLSLKNIFKNMLLVVNHIKYAIKSVFNYLVKSLVLFWGGMKRITMKQPVKIELKDENQAEMNLAQALPEQESSLRNNTSSMTYLKPADKSEGQERTSAYDYQPRLVYPDLRSTETGKAVAEPGNQFHKSADYQLPHIDLLTVPGDNDLHQQQKNSKDRAKLLESTLLSFGVKARVVHVQTGPTVTRFEVQPEAGVKVSKFVSLADDLALNLAAPLVRIEAPIPGKAALGIEVPNNSISLVHLREVMEDPGFEKSISPLTVGLGKDITGIPVIADLTKMPHLLIAGATGAGKSVCLNTIITSILYKAGPEQVRFMMIDPKVVELSVYNGIPQLLMPVLTDPRKAALALRNMVREMGRRYDLFARYGIRDISAYNELVEQEEQALEKLAYIVVVIDELADLMLVSPGEVEDSIARLAQMSRAAGIHLLVATQRPSVDVLTGIIKANITSRIAFTVSSQFDSRTILDMAGAEKLLGRGDMLFYPVGAVKPFRVQGAYVSEIEVKKVTDFIREQGLIENIETRAFLEETEEDEHETADKLFPEAVDLVVRTGQASISLLQRRFRIGYTRAARLIDDLERKGIVGPFEGSKPREVLVTEDEVSRICEEFINKDL